MIQVTHFKRSWDVKPEDKIDKELLRLNSLNKYVYCFNEEQRLELSKILKDNEVPQNRLIQIAENHLEDSFNFDSLINYLKKKEKKNLINI